MGNRSCTKKKPSNSLNIAQSNFPETYTRLYTCGDHIDAKILESLKDAGLQEIRFSIRMHDFEKGQRSIFDRIALAKDFIPYVMVEMPVLPDTLEEMKEILTELDRLGLFSINLLELCYPLANADVYREKGYKVKNRPFHVLYDYWYAGGVPVSRSELVCLDLLAFAAGCQSVAWGCITVPLKTSRPVKFTSKIQSVRSQRQHIFRSGIIS